MRVPGFARGARQFLTHAVRGREPGRVDRHLGLAFTPQRYVRVDAAIFQLQQIRLVAVARIGQYHRRQRGRDDERGREPGQDRNPRGGRPYKRAYGEPEPKAQDARRDW